MAMPNYSPAPQKSNKLWWILGGIGIFFLVCCGGMAGLGFFGFNKAKEAIDSHMAYGNGVMQRLSDANYVVGANSTDFDSSLTSGAEAANFANFLDLVGTKMGKYTGQGAMSNFDFKSENGTNRYELIFTGKFEKGEGTVEMVYTGDDANRRIIGIAVKSPLIQ